MRHLGHLFIVTSLFVPFWALGETPATLPSTRPTTTSSSEMDENNIIARLAEARRVAVDSRAAVISELARSDSAYKQAIADRDAAEKKLNAARAGSDTEAKLNASSFFNKARAKVAMLEKAAIDKSQSVKQADALLATAKIALADAAAARAKARNDAEAAQAAAKEADTERRKLKVVTKGMARAEVEDLWGMPETTRTSEDGSVVCIWHEYEMREVTEDPGNYRPEQIDIRNIVPVDRPLPKMKVLVRSLQVRFVNGKIAAFEDRKATVPK